MKSVKTQLLELERLYFQPIELAPAGESLGVDTVKTIIADAFTLTEGIIEMVGGNLSGGLFKIAGVASRYADNFKEVLDRAIAELRDMSQPEAEQVYDHVVREFDIKDDELEAKIEALLYLPVAGYKEYNDAIAVIAEIRPILNAPDLTFWEKAKAISEKVGPVVKELEDLFNLVADVIEVFQAFGKKEDA